MEQPSEYTDHSRFMLNATNITQNNILPTVLQEVPPTFSDTHRDLKVKHKQQPIDNAQSNQQPSAYFS